MGPQESWPRSMRAADWADMVISRMGLALARTAITGNRGARLHAAGHAFTYLGL